MKKCNHTYAFHIGHSYYSKFEYYKAKKRDSLDCCGGTIKLNYCAFCGKKNK